MVTKRDLGKMRMTQWLFTATWTQFCQKQQMLANFDKTKLVIIVIIWNVLSHYLGKTKGVDNINTSISELHFLYSVDRPNDICGAGALFQLQVVKLSLTIVSNPYYITLMAKIYLICSELLLNMPGYLANPSCLLYACTCFSNISA